jgi:ATPase subunit of ABC transporter with duplicated ATPase domains
LTLLHLSKVCISFQGVSILRNLQATLPVKAKIGIVGSNGSGKSTLLKAIVSSANEIWENNLVKKPLELDSGSIDWALRPRIGYVPQSFPYDLDGTPIEIVGHNNATYLGQCGVTRELWNNPARNLSGGERTRLSIACALSRNPELLILDEPTNHLDIQGIEWLEKKLKNFTGTLLTVSHDRFFLDAVCSSIWEIRAGSLKVYSGNYSSYLQQRRNEETHIARERGKWMAQIENLEKEVRERRQWFQRAHENAGKNDYLRRRSKKHASQFQAKELKLRRLLDKEPPKPRIDEKLTIKVSPRGYRTQTVARTSNLTFGYDSKSLLADLSFIVTPTQKIGLIGRNGCGKTTLLRLMTGELSPWSGRIWVNPNIKMGYLSQILEIIDLKKSAAENVSVITGLRLPLARNLLGQMGISNDKQVQPTGSMSMGERTRVALACLTMGQFDLLILDEPTNHLDLAARDAVEEVLISFTGAIILATHDRYLLDIVCNTIWSLEKGQLTVHSGNYTSYRNAMESRTIKPSVRDLKAKELALRTRLAFITSQIASSQDDEEKTSLDRQYFELVKKLNALKCDQD